MHFIERLQTICKSRRPALIVFHGPSVPPEAICAAVRAHSGIQTSVVRLRSDAINIEEGKFIRDALLDGQAPVMIGGEKHELPAQPVRIAGTPVENKSAKGAGNF
jgi:hypothetical protein